MSLGHAVEFVKDQYRHCKALFAIGAGDEVLRRAGIAGEDTENRSGADSRGGEKKQGRRGCGALSRPWGGIEIGRVRLIRHRCKRGSQP